MNHIIARISFALLLAPCLMTIAFAQKSIRSSPSLAAD